MGTVYLFHHLRQRDLVNEYTVPGIPNLLTECVRYLSLKHAIPTMRDDIAFVRNALDVLVELACPNQGVTDEQDPFFKELMLGIREAESDIQAS